MVTKAMYSMVSELNTGDDAERGSKHIWGVYCCQPQAVNGKFQDQKLPDQGNVTGIGQPDKPEPLGDQLRILHQHQPGRCQEHGEQGDQHAA